MKRTIVCVERDSKNRIVKVQTKFVNPQNNNLVSFEMWPVQAIFEKQDETEPVTDDKGNVIGEEHFDFYAPTTFATGTIQVKAKQDDDGVYFLYEDPGDDTHPKVEIIAPSCS